MIKEKFSKTVEETFQCVPSNSNIYYCSPTVKVDKHVSSEYVFVFDHFMSSKTITYKSSPFFSRRSRRPVVKKIIICNR